MEGLKLLYQGEKKKPNGSNLSVIQIIQLPQLLRVAFQKNRGFFPSEFILHFENAFSSKYLRK